MAKLCFYRQKQSSKLAPKQDDILRLKLAWETQTNQLISWVGGDNHSAFTLLKSFFVYPMWHRRILPPLRTKEGLGPKLLDEYPNILKHKAGTVKS